eukprot:11920527-Ditylum_brightwellii.AAC.1
MPKPALIVDSNMLLSHQWFVVACIGSDNDKNDNAEDVANNDGQKIECPKCTNKQGIDKMPMQFSYTGSIGNVTRIGK